MQPSAEPDELCPCKAGQTPESGIYCGHGQWALLHTILVCVWGLLRCCLLSTFFFRLINCRLSSEVTFSRPLICLGAYLCPPSSWATHWLKHGAQLWMQPTMKPLQCQVQWEGLLQMSCFFPVHTFHYDVSFSWICRTFLNFVWCVWSIATSKVFSLELQVANYFLQDMHSWLTQIKCVPFPLSN